MSVTHSHLKLLKKLKVAALSVQSQIIKGFTGVSKRIIVTLLLVKLSNESKSQTTNHINRNASEVYERFYTCPKFSWWVPLSRWRSLIGHRERTSDERLDGW